MAFEIDTSKILRWSKGSCENPGCTDETCVCAVCALPIGVREDDERWQTHDEYCAGCELCEDEVPILLFRRHNGMTEQAALHTACFRKISEQQRWIIG